MEVKDLIINYSEQILDDEIPACKKHKWACRRFLDDIEREDTEDFPYIFDSEKAMLFFEWMRMFKHTKGPLAGEHKEPAPIEIFIFGNIYGWYHRDSGYRRFKKGYWQVARKNAKSQDLSIVALYETFANGVQASEVYCAATKRDQAKIIQNEAEMILEQCDDLSGKYSIKYGKIMHPKSNSFMKALSKEDRKKGDGFSPQCAIIDEYHAHETSEIYDIMDSGMGARPNRLLMIITTAGFDLSNPCYRVEYDYVSQILDPNNPVENDKYFAMVNELDKNDDGELIDDIDNEDNWKKSNPILASYEEGMEYLREKHQEAKDIPEKKKNFLTKNMNIWVNAKENTYLKLDRWKNFGRDKLPDLSEANVFVGVDLSSKLDLTSVSFEFVLPNGDYVVKSHSFLPENRLSEKEKEDKIPYTLWAQNNWITLTEGDVVDYRYIQNYIVKEESEAEWNIQEICYDPYNATQFSNEISDEGYEMVEIRQGTKTLSEPTKDFRAEVYKGNVIHNKNPVLTWAVGNAITREDHNENIMLDKSKSKRRIDPIASVINAHVRAVVNEPPKKSVYEERGVRTL